MFDYTLIKYKKTVWLPASDWSCRVVSLGFFVMKQERPGMMHLKNVTKNSWLLLRPALEPREERALRGSGRVAAAGRGPGRCLRRRGKEDPGPAGRCRGRDELLKARSSSPRSPFASPPRPPRSTPRRPGRLPTGCRGREGVASPSGSGPRDMCPGHRGQCQAHALALSPRGSAGTTALRGHQTTRGQDGQSSPTKATFPQAVHEGSGWGSGTQKTSRRPARKRLYKLPVSRLFWRELVLAGNPHDFTSLPEGGSSGLSFLPAFLFKKNSFFMIYIPLNSLL